MAISQIQERILLRSYELSQGQSYVFFLSGDIGEKIGITDLSELDGSVRLLHDRGLIGMGGFSSRGGRICLKPYGIEYLEENLLKLDTD